eukprot:s2267_g13.t1
MLLCYEEDFRVMWENGGRFNCVGRTDACAWDEFLQEQNQNASCEGTLEIAAFARGADVRAWIVDEVSDEVHLLNPSGSLGCFALHYDSVSQHYRCYLDFVEQHLQARYVELGGKSLAEDVILRRGGGPEPSLFKRRRLVQSSGFAPAISVCASSEGHSCVDSVARPVSAVGKRSRPPALSDCSSGRPCSRVECEVPCARSPASHLKLCQCHALLALQLAAAAPEDVPVPFPAKTVRPVLSLSEGRRICGQAL